MIKSIKYGSGLYGFDKNNYLVYMSHTTEIYDILEMPVDLAVRVVQKLVGRSHLFCRAGRSVSRSTSIEQYSPNDFQMLLINESLDIRVKIALIEKLEYKLLNYHPDDNYQFGADYTYDKERGRLVSVKYSKLSAKHISQIMDDYEFPIDRLFAEITPDQIKQVLETDPYTYYNRKTIINNDDIIIESIPAVVHFLPKCHGLSGTKQLHIMINTDFKAPPEFYTNNSFDDLVNCLLTLNDSSIQINNGDWIALLITRRPEDDFWRLIPNIAPELRRSYAKLAVY